MDITKHLQEGLELELAFGLVAVAERVPDILQLRNKLPYQLRETFIQKMYRQLSPARTLKKCNSSIVYYLVLHFSSSIFLLSE